LEPDGDDLGAKATSLRRDEIGSGDDRTCIRLRAVAKPQVSRYRMATPPSAWDLKYERGQLIERVDDLQAHKNERCDHQIKAKMHEELATKCFLPRADRARS
jgi:hypothetical protein